MLLIANEEQFLSQRPAYRPGGYRFKAAQTIGTAATDLSLCFVMSVARFPAV